MSELTQLMEAAQKGDRRAADLLPFVYDDLLKLDVALDRLAAEYPAAAKLARLRFFAGTTLAEEAEALGLSRRTADRHWSFSRAWLADALADG